MQRKQAVLQGLLLAGLLLPALAHAGWTRSWVIEWNEPAMYYGADSGVIDPGSDCPAGTNPEIDWVEVLVRAGYSRAEAEWLRDPANPTRSPRNGQNQMAFRGEGRANVYTHPETYPDPGLTGVSGDIGEGFDLDGDPGNGFVSPEGERGIDNAFYRTLGCWKTYRGPHRLSGGALTFNDAMRNGGWTMVIVASGEGDDERNDDNVRVGIYLSEDKLVKGGNGEIVADYTFRIQPHQVFEGIFAARTEGGVIHSTEPSPRVVLRDPSFTRELELLQARLRLTMQADGSLQGLIGGYRPWMPVYQGWVDARGPVIESLTWVELPGVYYALQRGADYSPPGSDGERTHISYALRVDAVPAFVMEPDASREVAQVRSYRDVAEEDNYKAPFAGYVVNGIVPDRSGKYYAGPDAVILPPQSGE
ncbi:hypothetical protein [Parahaliea aestuarii]|uniref:Uncharacterized protein n=1 Tax=Parahaliea aestuarii TaxID=1852021 RepID=A0A5C9A3W8_9GAMM|nr:hypothetical protein [Parahaliea aestuarii]TXS94684.1 hypothetical protein FVW59_01870 [Parahaliea aestuarii]